MLAGLLYKANDESLIKERRRAKELCYDFNACRPSEVAAQAEIIRNLFGKTGGNFEILAPFFCDYGYNIEIGDNFFANHNLIILENGSVYTWGNTNNGKLGYFEDNFSQEVPKELFQMKIVFINKVCLGNEITVIVGGKEEDSIINKLKPKEPELIEVENH